MVVFSMPGKIGDALLQYPVARQWSRQTGEKFSLWLDEQSLKPLVGLFQSQPCVESVELKPGITGYSCGGQPWNFGLDTAEFEGKSVYHLGFRQFPQRQITLQTALDCGLHIDTSQLAHPSLEVEPLEPANRCVIHGTFQSHVSGVPRFWRWLRDIRSDLEARFDEIVFTGSPAERARALEVYPAWRDFDDGRDFHRLARYMAGSRLVVGSGSSGVVLGGALGLPTVRVHDPIGEAPKVVWSNLGDNQLNDWEPALRESWPKFRDRWVPLLAPAQSVAEVQA